MLPNTVSENSLEYPQMLHKWKFWITLIITFVVFFIVLCHFMSIHKTTEIHFQIVCPCVKADESCQAIWRKKILCVASSNVEYGTQASRHAQNEGWEHLIRNISTNAHNSLGQESQVCWEVVYVVQSTSDFRPKVLDRFQIRWHSRPIHLLLILIFEEINDASHSVCWNIVILERKQNLPGSLS
jgi:hypothetical protein